MGNVLKAIDIVQLGTGFSTYYTVPGATKFTVSMLHLHNTTSSAVTVQVCAVPTAGSPTQATALLWNFSLLGNDVLEILKGDIWTPGTTLQALAGTGSAVNLKMAGIESS